jgi:hypothetical protein
MGTGDIILGVRGQRREVDQSSPSSAEVKNAWSYTFTPPYIFTESYLIKHRYTFTFYGEPYYVISLY